MSIGVDLDLRGVVRALDALPRALDDALESAVRRAAKAVAEEAKSSHSYTDRTGNLTRSIRALDPSGRFTDDTLEGGVTATMPYASYVEEGTTTAPAFQYLGSAWILQRHEVATLMDDGLEAAIRRVGL